MLKDHEKILIDQMFALFYKPVTAEAIKHVCDLWEVNKIPLLTKSPSGGNIIFHLMVSLPYSDSIAELCQELNQKLPKKSDLPKVLNNSGKTVYDLSKQFNNNSVIIYDTIYIFCKVEYYFE